MNYQVRIQRLAWQDLQSVYQKAKSRAPVQALQWLNRFEQALQTLDQRPDRCALAWEHRKIGIELREFHFGRRPWVFRVIFVIDGSTVRVLRILRAQRRHLTSKEIGEALEES